MRKHYLEVEICEAIEKHRIIEFKYKEEITLRKFAPHAVYKSTHDKILVSGLQLIDYSEPHKEPIWHKFEVKLINELVVLDDTFEPDPEFSSFEAEHRDTIVCAVDRF